ESNVSWQQRDLPIPAQWRPASLRWPRRSFVVTYFHDLVVIDDTASPRDQADERGNHDKGYVHAPAECADEPARQALIAFVNPVDDFSNEHIPQQDRCDNRNEDPPDDANFERRHQIEVIA